MRLQITVTELTEGQWALLQDQVKTSYEFAEGASRVCVTFEHGELERHAEMPVGTFTGLLAGLGLASATELLFARNPVVRQDCAFCHRERSAKDDNHADDCPYWTVGPGSLKGRTDK